MSDGPAQLAPFPSASLRARMVVCAWLRTLAFVRQAGLDAVAISLSVILLVPISARAQDQTPAPVWLAGAGQIVVLVFVKTRAFMGSVTRRIAVSVNLRGRGLIVTNASQECFVFYSYGCLYSLCSRTVKSPPPAHSVNFKF